MEYTKKEMENEKHESGADIQQSIQWYSQTGKTAVKKILLLHIT